MAEAKRAYAGCESSRTEHTTCRTRGTWRSRRVDSGPLPEKIGGFRILGEIGHGGEATVYQAVDPILRDEFALKWSSITVPSYELHPLVAEGRLLGSIDNDGCVRVHQTGWCSGRPYLVLDSIDGGSLHDLVDRGRRPSARRAAALVAEVARTVAALHDGGIVHRDIKPQNIMVDRDGRPRLIDFGIACRLRGARDETARPASAGTVTFLAPEQARLFRKREFAVTEEITAAVDIFGLGATLHFLLTGRSPYKGKTADEILEQACRCEIDHGALSRAKVSESLRRVCLTAMAASPEERYGSAIDMACDLERGLRVRTGSRLDAGLRRAVP